MTRTEEHIRALCNWPHRGSTSTYENLAAEYARRTFEEHGYQTVVEKFNAPDSALYRTYILMSVCAAISCLLAFKWPVAAVFTALIPIVYLFAEFYLMWPVHNLLFPGGSSQNVVAKAPHNGARAKVILSGHLDTQLGSYLFSKKWVKYQPLLTNGALGGVIAALLLAIMRLFGFHGFFVSTLLMVDTALMIVLAVLFGRAEWTGKYVQGANDDASGSAVMMALAEDLHKVPPANIEVWAVATGCEESGLCGMSHFMRKGRGRGLDKTSTYFINFDNLGSGDLIYLTGETIPGFSYPGPLKDFAGELESDRHAPPIKPGWWGVPTDALIPALQGYPSITLFGYDKDRQTPNYHYWTDTVENIDFDLPEKARAFALELIRRIDRHVAENKTSDDIET